MCYCNPPKHQKKSTSSLRSTWACPKLGRPEIEWDIIVFLIEMSTFGLPSFQDKPISPLFMEKHLCLTHNLGKTHDPMHPLWFPQTKCSSIWIPIQSPLGQFFFGSRRPSLSGIWLPLSHGSPLATLNPVTFGRSLFTATNRVRIDHGSKPAIDNIHFEMF